jgi:hypothetical protein
MDSSWCGFRYVWITTRRSKYVLLNPLWIILKRNCQSRGDFRNRSQEFSVYRSTCQYSVRLASLTVTQWTGSSHKAPCLMSTFRIFWHNVRRFGATWYKKRTL